MVHLEGSHLPEDLIAYRAEIDEALVERLDAVPAAWFDDPLARQTRRFGDGWAAERRSLALRVPSAVVPGEFNLLLNPLHPDRPHLRLVNQAPFRLDPRLAR